MFLLPPLVMMLAIKKTYGYGISGWSVHSVRIPDGVVYPVYYTFFRVARYVPTRPSVQQGRKPRSRYVRGCSTQVCVQSRRAGTHRMHFHTLGAHADIQTEDKAQP
ncbi:hypothetical protein B0T17DRAFT_528308, partial [Bombardia bombarda]